MSDDSVIDNLIGQFATVDERVGEVNFTAPISQNGLSEYYLANNIIHAGTENQIIDSSKCSILHGSNNIIKDKYNCHIIGDYIGQEGITDIDDNSFNVGCYNGLNSWGKITVKRGGAEINGNLLIKEDSSSSTAGLILTNFEESVEHSVRLTQSISDIDIEDASDMMQLVFLASPGSSANWWSGGWFLRDVFEASVVNSSPPTLSSSPYSDQIAFKHWVYLSHTFGRDVYYKIWDGASQTWINQNRMYKHNITSWYYITVQTPVFSQKQSFWMYNSSDDSSTFPLGKTWLWTSIEAWPFFYISGVNKWAYAFISNTMMNNEADPIAERVESIINTFDLSSDEVLGSIQTSESIDPGRDLVIDSTDQDQLGNLVVEGSIKSAYGDIVMGATAMGDEIKIIHDHNAPDSEDDYSGTGGSSGNKPTDGTTNDYKSLYELYPKGSIYINSGQSSELDASEILYVKTANSGGWEAMSSVSYVDQKAQAVAMRMGVIAHGSQVPLPSGFEESQCKWIVSAHFLPSDHGDHNKNHNITVKTGGQNNPDVNGRWVYANPVGGTGNTQCLVNYLIIGVK